MVVYVVSGDEDGKRGGAPVVCAEDASRRCFEFSIGQANWTPVLLLVPLFLGLDKVNPRYLNFDAHPCSWPFFLRPLFFSTQFWYWSSILILNFFAYFDVVIFFLFHGYRGLTYHMLRISDFVIPLIILVWIVPIALLQQYNIYFSKVSLFSLNQLQQLLYPLPKPKCGNIPL